MSISPPSDIVLDVARAADPARLQRASALLTRAAAGTETFDDVLGESATKPAALLPAARTPSATARLPTAAEAYRGFEAMALASMIEAALPRESSAIYGSGTAGNIWKSMLAEQLGKQMADAGGIGIAKQLAASQFASSTSEAASQAATRSATETLLVAAIERGFVGDMMTSQTAQDDNS